MDGNFNTSGQFRENYAFMSGQHGFFFDGVVAGGSIVSNTAERNGTTSTTLYDGFHFDSITGGSITNNIATQNTGDGFDIVAQTGGSFIGQRSNSNTVRGYGAPAGVAPVIRNDNTGSGNASNDNLPNYP